MKRALVIAVLGVGRVAWAQPATDLAGDELPVRGTTVAPALQLVPRATDDGNGLAIAGASSLENTFLLDGGRINDATHGSLATRIPLELVRSIEVSTAGWDAASPGALGAVVRIVTRSGSDVWHGSVFATLAPGWLAGQAKSVRTATSTIDVRSDVAYDATVGATLSGPIVDHHLWFFAAFAPELARTDHTRRVLSQTDCRQPGMTGPCEAQLADGLPDVDPKTGAPITDVVASEVREAPARAYTAFGRLDLAYGDHQAFASALITPYSVDQPELVGAPSTGTQRHGVEADVTARWLGKIADQVELETGVALHHSSAAVDALDPAAQGTQRTTLVDPSFSAVSDFESPAVVSGCTDGGATDHYPRIVNCPLGQYATGGPGALSNESDDRISTHAAAHGTVVAAGVHRVEAGLDVESDRSSSLAWLSGGASVVSVANLSFVDRPVRLSPSGAMSCETPDQGTFRLFRCDDVTASSPPILEDTTRTAAYVQDAWEPRAGLTFEAGVRWERQQLAYASNLRNAIDPVTGVRHGDVAIDVRGIAPRAGVTFDPIGDGSAKLYAHWGRAFEAIPLWINDRTLTIAPTFEQLFSAAAPLTPQFEHLIGFASAGIARGVGPQFQDSWVAGGELAVTPDLRLAASYEQRAIGRVIEDASDDGGASYFVVNPGESPGFASFDKPRRDYRALTIALAQRLGSHGLARESYTYARTEGNYPGLISYDNGQVEPNASSQYDVIELMANRAGPLPQDRPSILTIEAYDVLPVDRTDAIVLGVVAVGRSGTPVSALGGHYLYGPDESYLLPRGALGRTPFATELDCHLGYRHALGHGRVLDAYVDVLDADDRQATTGVDQTYTSSLQNANPISGGSYRDLLWLKSIDTFGNETSTPIRRNPQFMQPLAYRSPISARLGVRLSF